MEIIPVKTRRITQEDSLLSVFLEHYTQPITEGDIVVLTSKVVSVVEKNVVPCTTDEEFEQIIYSESEKILGQHNEFGFFLTEKNGMMMPNAGIDKSNSEKGTVILLPKDSQKSADNFRKKLQEKYGVKKLGVIICDSRVLPFRQGISGSALAWSGFVGVSDERGKQDMFGRKLEVSQMAVADNISSIAQIFFGQADEKIPFIVCKNAPVEFTDAQQNSADAAISVEDDLFTSILRN